MTIAARGSARRRTVLVVDDSAFMRRLVRDILAGSEFEVVGVARNGHDAIARVHRLEPDLVTLDVEMPELSGIDVLGYIMSEAPRPVVMLSAFTTAGAELSLRALDYGAVDIVAKPGGLQTAELDGLAERLLAALRAAADADLRNVRVHIALRAGQPVSPPVPVPVPRPLGAGTGVAAVAIAASTGGPRALAEVVPRLRAPLGAAVFVVQHMPAGFTALLARRLDAVSRLPVVEAVHGAQVEADRVYIAPGDFHMTVRREAGTARIVLDREPPLRSLRPAADRTFASVAEVFGAATIGIVLTGMGRDGADGLAAIRGAGGQGAVQDRATSVVFGMPRVAAAHADATLPLDAIAPWIEEAVAALGHPPLCRPPTFEPDPQAATRHLVPEES
jgi:two-component system, chemotaxis family, protein-glutamate methylesterase/glutaminase